MGDGLAGEAPVVAAPLLGVALVVGAAVTEEGVLGWAAEVAALWQPTSASRMAEASTSFFIIVSEKCVG